jgi:hypothetical protein
VDAFTVPSNTTRVIATSWSVSASVFDLPEGHGAQARRCAPRSTVSWPCEHSAHSAYIQVHLKLLVEHVLPTCPSMNQSLLHLYSVVDYSTRIAQPLARQGRNALDALPVP